MAKKTSKKKVVKKTTKKKVSKVKPKVELSKTEKEQNKQLIVFFTIMLVILGGFLAGYFYVQQLNKFSYAGVDFIRGKTGEVVYYHGRFQMPAERPGAQRVIYNLYLRLDPRKVRVPINTDEFALSQQVIIAFSPEIGQCKDTIIAHANMKQFFEAFPWVVSVGGATTSEEYAEERNLTFANCDSAEPYKTIIQVQASEKNSIEKEGNCYILNVKDCEYLEVSEKFILGFVGKINSVKI
jgi:hypothetical protein